MQNSKNNKQLDNIRHSLAHLLAAVVLERQPKAKLGIGPTIENGFYYDFLLPRNISSDELASIEKDIKSLIKKELPFKGKKITPSEAKKLFKNQPFKLELIKDLSKEKQQLTAYSTGDIFMDLCKGGHVKNTREINPDAFKLTHTAGAYWKGDEKNQQMQRIYGVAFENKKELDEHLAAVEEAKKRDHRKLGQELDLFTFSELVGAGLPLFTPKGTIIRTELQNALLKISKKYNIQPVTIPHIAKIDLYEKSGHAEKFGDELFKVTGHYGQDFVMKPVSCPHHTQIYASRPRSYRDLPLRYMESTMQYRDEKPGEIGGLTRVRAITVDDGHVFCTLDQVKVEAKNIAKIIEEFYSGLGMYGNHWISLSVRDPKTPEKYIGDDKDWKKAEKILKEVSNDLELNAKKMEGEAALYGPKLDFMFRDSLGRERQLATIQIDFAMPKRFELSYTDEKGKSQTPVIIHRAILGSYERFLAILIEHFAGAFPLWLSPVQVVIIPVSEKQKSYAHLVKEALLFEDIRVEVYDSNDTLGKRIREAETQKTPYIIIVGEKEETNKTISIRGRGRKDLGEMEIKKFISKAQKEIRVRKI